jgi:hypothetical protein
MNCAWCCPSDNGTDGICDSCAENMILQSAQRQFERVPSYAETNARQFAAECDEILSQEEIAA